MYMLTDGVAYAPRDDIRMCVIAAARGGSCQVNERDSRTPLSSIGFAPPQTRLRLTIAAAEGRMTAAWGDV